MSGESSNTIEFYDLNAAGLAAAYEGLSAAEVWAPVREFIPTGAGKLALDFGAGTGRDAAWLSSLGLEVVAVEPAEGMRREGGLRHPALRWLDDRLPGLDVTSDGQIEQLHDHWAK